jgi:hypothetical protein
MGRKKKDARKAAAESPNVAHIVAHGNLSKDDKS